MKRAVVTLALCIPLAGCSLIGGKESDDARQRMEAYYDKMVEDGVTTPDEWAEYTKLAQRWLDLAKGEASSGWDAFLEGMASGSVPAAGAAVALHYIRNRREKKVWGTPTGPAYTGPTDTTPKA